MPKETASSKTERPPVVTVMGHIDHGKSTLLDYIRNTKVADTEAGGITQHLSAYEVEHTLASGKTKKITFLDTPGHEAFQHLRSRGSKAADIAILVVSAEDGVKPQTLEALAAIQEGAIPYIVAITKIDKPNANIERVKNSLLENGIYLEGLGGNIAYVPISSKSGEGIPALLDLLLLAAELEELTGDAVKTAEGIVIESHRDPKKGISATLIIKNGTLKSGSHIVAGRAMAPLRLIQDFKGKQIKEATFSSPVTVVGWNDIPPVGELFVSVASKKDAEKMTEQVAMRTSEDALSVLTHPEAPADVFLLPVIIKADVVGSIEAIRHELAKSVTPRSGIKILREGVGAVSENDVKLAQSAQNAFVLGFSVAVDSAAQEYGERTGIEIQTFDIIYRLSEWLTDAIETKRPKTREEEKTGTAKVLKIFSSVKKMHLIGLRIEDGSIKVGANARVSRRGEPLGSGKLVSLQEQKTQVKEVEKGKECGAQFETTADVAAGDTLECFVIVEK